MSSAPIYLDYAAATPVDPAVIQAMEPYYAGAFYNPSATYMAARAVAADLQAARQKVAHWLGAKPSEIIFTAGGTEANNLAISGVMSQFPDKEVVISSIEHESVREAVKPWQHRGVAVTTQGLINLEALRAAITENTVLVSMMYANNEIGSVQPLKEVASILQTIREQRREKGNKTPLLLHSDACQAGNYLDIHTARLGVDLMTLNGGKIYGPKQSGVLYVKTGLVLEPLIRGGGQERGLRSGTENVAGAVGFATALDVAQTMRADESRRLSKLRDGFIADITAAIPEVVVNGSPKKHLPNNLSLTFPGKDNERLMMQLDEAGIICAVGSACSASKDESSHVLRAIGLSDDEARATLRFTLGRQTSLDDITRVVHKLQELVHG